MDNTSNICIVFEDMVFLMDAVPLAKKQYHFRISI